MCAGDNTTVGRHPEHSELARERVHSKNRKERHQGCAPLHTGLLLFSLFWPVQGLLPFFLGLTRHHGGCGRPGFLPNGSNVSVPSAALSRSGAVFQSASLLLFVQLVCFQSVPLDTYFQIIRLQNRTSPAFTCLYRCRNMH